MLSIPSYWLPRPAFAPDSATQAAFEHLFVTAVAPGTGESIAYTLATPKWQFLTYLVDQHQIALHGCGTPDIAHFEPRQATDTYAFGNQRAVYAAADGIWSMFFAIVDRDHFRMSVVNACVQFAVGNSPLSEPHYFFSVSQSALQQQAWRSGVMYLLPGTSFARQEPMEVNGVFIHTTQLASLVPVKPLAKLLVSPSDFPFLSHIRGHDDEVLAARATANPAGFPWVNDDDR